MRLRLVLPSLICLTLLAGSSGCSDATEPEPEPKPAEKTPNKPSPSASAPSADLPDQPKPDKAPAASGAELADAAPTPNTKLPTELLEAAKDGYELLSPGVEPLDELRFAPKVGQVEKIKLTMSMSMSIVGPGIPPTVQKLPPLEQVNRAETLSISDGRIEEKIVFESFAVDGAGANAQMAAMMQSTMEQISGFEQTMIYDDRGGVIDGEMAVPEDASPQLAQTLETMSKTFAQVMVRFPEVPVGVGAKWKETSEFDNNGIKLEQTSEFELVARDGDTITLDTQITQRPLSDKFKPANMPMGEVDLLDFESKGGGVVIYDLSKLMPDRVNTRVETKFSIEATVAGQSQKMTTEIEIELGLERI